MIKGGADSGMIQLPPLMMTNKQYALAVRSALAAVPGELRRHREGKVVNYIYATDDGDLKWRVTVGKQVYVRRLDHACAHHDDIVIAGCLWLKYRIAVSILDRNGHA